MHKDMSRVELLAPAGDMSKLVTAFHFGADAVYVGGSDFGLRAGAANFGAKEMPEAVAYAHERGKKLYTAVNVFARNADFGALADHFRFLSECGVDAAIVTDLGAIELCRKVAPALDIHVSTQANVTNKYAAKVYADMGAKRVVLARETRLDEIAEICDLLGDGVEIEAFVHGAMCVSYSGRCLLSAAMSGRSANRGNCAQPCRWNFELTEAGRGGAHYPVFEDGRGTYILNSGDLNMIRHLRELADAGVKSFKIEGRMKSQYYVASTVSAYRRAMDGFAADDDFVPGEDIIGELEQTAHRAYTTGFYFGAEGAKVSGDVNQTEGESEFVALVLGYDETSGRALVEQRNAFAEGDTLQLLAADEAVNGAAVEVRDLRDEEGAPVKRAKLVQQHLTMPVPCRMQAYDILRRKKV